MRIKSYYNWLRKKTCPLDKIIIVANTKQKNPAKATVVNFGVSFLHLKDTENTENPIEDVIPNTNPTKEFLHYYQMP
jgi:hypothetical protein